MNENNLKGPVVLFDGVCNLCNDSVKFIIKRDPKCIFKFSPLQSEFGLNTLKDMGLASNSLETFILIESGKYYIRSEAALRVVRRLSGLWPLVFGFIIVPRPLRDWVYRYIARNRYKWFGKRDECMVPSPEDRERFVE